MEVKDLILPGTCYEKCLGSVEEKDIFLPGTNCEKMKSAWKKYGCELPYFARPYL